MVYKQILKTDTMKAIESFEMNACDVNPHEESMTCTVYVDVDGWDSHKRAYEEIEYFAEGSNDPMGEEIEIELEEMGLELIYPGELIDDDVVEFKMRRI